MNTTTTQISLRYKLKWIPSASSSPELDFIKTLVPKAIFCISASALLFHFPLPPNEYQILNAAVLNSGTLGGFFRFHLFQKDLASDAEEIFDFHSQPFLPTGDNGEGDFVGLYHEMRIMLQINWQLIVS